MRPARSTDGGGLTSGLTTASIPPLLRAELLASAELGSFRPFRGFQGSTVLLPPEIALALTARAAPRLEAFESPADPAAT